MSTLRFLALGDSYTIGEGVPLHKGWPAQLTALAARNGIPFNDPVIIATTGWTTDELLEGIESANLEPPYDLVTLLIGVNNQYRGYPIVQYEEEFNALLQRAIAFATEISSVIVLSIPDWGTTPFAADRDRNQIASEIDHYNEINRTSTQRAGCAYVDITTLTRSYDQLEDWVEDGLHPASAIYTQWADKVYSVLARM